MDATTFLDKSEIEILTGFKLPIKQTAQLKKQGIPFFTDGRNRPVVLRESISKPNKPQPVAISKWQPNIMKA